MAVRKPAGNDAGDLDVRWVDIEALKPDPNNARRHSERNLTAIEASLRRFGQRKPLVVDQDMVVVAGNGTLDVMRNRLGTRRVCVSVFPGTAAEARAFGIADNRTGELSTWNKNLLADTLAKFDTSLLAAAGWNPEEHDDLQQYLQPATPIPEFAPTPYFDPASAALDPEEESFTGEPAAASAASIAPSDHDQRYAAKAQWTLFYDYPNAVFVWMIEQLAAYRQKHGLESNADAVVRVVEQVTGSAAPGR